MKFKNMTKLLSLTLAATLSLTACGGGESGAGTGSQIAARGTTLSQFLSRGERIWYLVSGSTESIGKDTQVEQIFLLEPDGSAYCGEVTDLSLGDVAQMESAELTQLAKTAQRETSLGQFYNVSSIRRLSDKIFGSESVIEEYLLYSVYDPESINLDDIIPSSTAPEANTLLEAWKDTLRNYSEQLLTLPGYPSDLIDFYGVSSLAFKGDYEDDEAALRAELENMVADPTALEMSVTFCREYAAAADAILQYLSTYEGVPGQYKLALNTDQTGNQAESVTLACGVPLFAGGTEVISFTCYATDGEAQEIYDTSFGGINVDGGAFVTQMAGSYSFPLDQPGEGDLPVDTEPEDLFA